MPGEQAITQMIHRLKDGDESAVDQLWELYFDRLVGMARNRLNGQPRRVADEEDVTVSVFKSLWHGAVRGQFPQLTNRDDLWRLLLTITKQKVVDEIRRNKALKRGGGEVRGNSIFAIVGESNGSAGFDRVVGDGPDPEFVAVLDEQLSKLMGRLRDDSLRSVAVWRMEGESNAEIAAKLGLGERSVERKLQLIRERWAQELDS
jgi:DNA-directed RNA polymerase specialized sigma24 family protein